LGGLCFACRKGVERVRALDLAPGWAVGPVASVVLAAAVVVAAVGPVVGTLGRKSRWRTRTRAPTAPINDTIMAMDMRWSRVLENAAW
jgi:hypothetical protein